MMIGWRNARKRGKRAPLFCPIIIIIITEKLQKEDNMKKRLFVKRSPLGRNHSAAKAALLVLVLLMALLSGCAGSAGASKTEEPEETDNAAGQNEPAEGAAPGAESGRENGERFEEVISLEGMEEIVRYEHIRNDRLGFEMDYDYERFERYSGADRECFVSVYDDPENPENYLEVSFRAQDAETVAAAVSEALSADYEIGRDDAFPLKRAGSCIRIDASNVKGNTGTPDLLQMVYIIPAADGCRVATAHYSFESAEGFGRRFHYMMESFSPVARQGEIRITDDQALAAIQNYCRLNNPDLEKVENAGEYQVYWEIVSSDAKEIVVLFRSYTGAQIRYYIDPVSGDTTVTEFVPGISSAEERTDESLNVWEYIG
jgi:hypothetical protein